MQSSTVVKVIVYKYAAVVIVTVFNTKFSRIVLRQSNIHSKIVFSIVSEAVVVACLCIDRQLTR